MRKEYVSPEIEFANFSNDVVATSSTVETGRIPFSITNSYTELEVVTDSPVENNYNT